MHIHLKLCRSDSITVTININVWQMWLQLKQIGGDILDVRAVKVWISIQGGSSELYQRKQMDGRESAEGWRSDVCLGSADKQRILFSACLFWRKPTEFWWFFTFIGSVCRETSGLTHSDEVKIKQNLKIWAVRKEHEIGFCAFRFLRRVGPAAGPGAIDSSSWECDFVLIRRALVSLDNRRTEQAALKSLLAVCALMRFAQSSDSTRLQGNRKLLSLFALFHQTKTWNTKTHFHIESPLKAQCLDWSQLDNIRKGCHDLWVLDGEVDPGYGE